MRPAADDSAELMNSGRIMQCFMYERKGPNDNHYAHPLDLVVFLDMTTRRILSTLAHDGPPRIPQHSCNYLAPLVERERGLRNGLKPLNVLQPEGPSFEVVGNHVRWQKWDLRVGFNHREGLVLHNVGYASAPQPLHWDMAACTRFPSALRLSQLTP